MKKCPFCAEEIQEEAIKCRWCGSFVSAAPDAAAAPAPSPAAAPGPLRPVAPADDRASRRVLYAGVPSWRAYLKEYFFAFVVTAGAPALGLWATRMLEVGSLGQTLAVLIPIGVGLVVLGVITLYRRSKCIRVTSTNIETEYGLLSKKIDVLELWRCRDVRYKQSLLDRILRIAHIDIFTTDVTTPNVCLEGLPASRELFEQIRDSIEIQRQARNVVGFVQ